MGWWTALGGRGSSAGRLPLLREEAALELETDNHHEENHDGGSCCQWDEGPIVVLLCCCVVLLCCVCCCDVCWNWRPTTTMKRTMMVAPFVRGVIVIIALIIVITSNWM